MDVFKRFIRTVLLAGVVALPFVVFWQQRNISDWWRLRDYVPPARIVELADNTQMTDEGRKLFYLHKPELNDRDAFNRNCKGFEQTIVLGCYVTNQAIYIFDVQDARLEGIEEVTSAHEMLHAAYDRLSVSEREAVDRMTQSAFDGLRDARLAEVVESYRQRDASVVSNELHSILATEFRTLPKQLEDYYERYFHDRLTVVGFSEKYEAVFTEQMNRIKTLSDQIAAIENDLQAQIRSVDELETGLSADADRLNSLRAQNRVDEYNAGVSPYNARIGQYRRLIADYNAKVQRMNQLVEEHNSVAFEQKKLTDAIDSNQPSL